MKIVIILLIVCILYIYNVEAKIQLKTRTILEGDIVQRGQLRNGLQQRNIKEEENPYMMIQWKNVAEHTAEQKREIKKKLKTIVEEPFESSVGKKRRRINENSASYGIYLSNNVYLIKLQKNKQRMQVVEALNNQLQKVEMMTTFTENDKTLLNFDGVHELLHEKDNTKFNDIHKITTSKKRNKRNAFEHVLADKKSEHRKAYEHIIVRVKTFSPYATKEALMKDILLKEATITYILPNLFKVTMHKFYDQTLNDLRKHHNVIWIERELEHDVKNFGAQDVIQSGGSNDHQKLWNKGLTGKGQIIAVGDTGIDWDMCFFNDERGPPAFNDINLNHRKIVGYFQVKKEHNGQTIYSDTQDYVNGHGTHVSGSVAGNVNGTEPANVVKFAGTSKEGKLLFIDMHNTEHPEWGLITPDNLVDDYFGLAYEGGARIHSNSWGCSYSTLFSCHYATGCTWDQDNPYGKKGEQVPDIWCMNQVGRRCVYWCNTYSSNAVQIDQFSVDHDDALIVFAAGNDGNAADEFTLGAPSTAKNCLTIGASMTTNGDFLEGVDYAEIQGYLDYFHFENEAACCQYSGDNADLVHSLCCTDYMKKMYQDTERFNDKNLADFSSRGPTLNDMRIKPDVVTPGMIINSAHSDGNVNTFQCSDIRPNRGNEAAIMRMQGTSMATPLASGAVGLVRQYFVDGYYPSGHANAADSFEPSGPLMKAMMVHSAQPMEGTVMVNGQPQKLSQSYPNSQVGFGVVNLDSVFYFDDGERGSWNLSVHDRVDAIKNTTHLYCYKTTENVFGNPIRATLTWFDPPAAENADHTLINDLDLTAYVGGMYYPGNNVESGDSVNNVEQIRANAPTENTVVAILVSSKKMKDDHQMFSLVVSGYYLELVDDQVCMESLKGIY